MAVYLYKSKNTPYTGIVDTPLSIDTRSDSTGFKVIIDTSVITYNGKTYLAQTSFTPQ
ncbi:MAG: hypothetical protein Q8930_09270 [Bacillota bacterium]|nr:hypothetical protein [Bacillota bacterium]